MNGFQDAVLRKLLAAKDWTRFAGARQRAATSLVLKGFLERRPAGIGEEFRLLPLGENTARKLKELEPKRVVRRVVDAESAGFNLGGQGYFCRLACGHQQEHRHHNLFKPPQKLTCDICTKELHERQRHGAAEHAECGPESHAQPAD